MAVIQSVKRIKDLNIQLTNILIEKGIESSSEETTTSLINKVSKLKLDTDKLFEGLINKTITKINIPEDFTNIYNNIFSDCSALTEITIPDSVINIGEGAFRNCSSLENILIPDGVTSIGNSAFYNCSKLTNINIPDGVTSIGNSAFYNCSKLTNINIPDGVTSIGNSAFAGCVNVTEVIIPDTVTNIGDSAFANCGRSLTKTIIGNGVTTIPYQCFFRSGVRSIRIPSNIKNMGHEAFRYSLIESVILENGIQSLGAQAIFMECGNLKVVSLPNSLVSININTFNRSTALEFVTLEQGFNCSLNISASTLYSIETLVAMLEALADLTGQTAKTLTLGTTNLAKLSDEQKAIAINKNWTLA